MRARFEKLGSVGLNTDVAPTLLPTGAWTSLYNISTEDGSIRSAYGDRKLFDLVIRPKYQFSYMDETVQKVIVSNGLVVHAYAMDGSHEDISPAVPLVEGIVTFTTLNGILVVNTENSGPYYWAGFGTVLVALPGWDSGWKCKQILGFHNTLVALNMTESSATYQHKIRWSNSADPGAIPTIWVPAAENDAGDAIIGETPGVIVTGILLRDFLAVVKEDAIYSMRYIGGSYVMQLERMSGSVGTRVLKGVAINNSSLAIFTIGDLLLYDGQNLTSLVESRIRRGISQAVSEEYWKNCEVFAFNSASLLVLGLIGAGYTRMNSALIFNADDGTWSHRALAGAYGFGKIQVTVEPGLKWDDLATPGVIWIAGTEWDTQVGAGWDKGLYHPSTDDFIAYQSSDDDTAWWVTAISAFETSSDGIAKNCVATRTGIPIEGADKLVMVTRIWPEFIASIPTQIWIGSQMTSDGDVTWQGPFTSIPNDTFSITPRMTCRFLSVRIESNGIGHWRLPALTVDYETAGER